MNDKLESRYKWLCLNAHNLCIKVKILIYVKNTDPDFITVMASETQCLLSDGFLT